MMPMSSAGLQGSRAYSINGLVMVVAFFVCRVAALPWQVGFEWMRQYKAVPTRRTYFDRSLKTRISYTY